MESLWRRAEKVMARLHARDLPFEMVQVRKGKSSDGGIGMGVEVKIPADLTVAALEVFLEYLDAEGEINGEDDDELPPPNFISPGGPVEA